MLKKSFQTLQMQDSESIQCYCSRVITIVNYIQRLGYKLSEDEVVSKVLRSLAPKFDYVVMATEECKDTSKISLDDLNGSLQAHEIRVN